MTEAPDSQPVSVTDVWGGRTWRINDFWEYKTNATLFGLPLVHCVSSPCKPGTKGLYVAKGVFAMGILSFGVITFGTMSLGVLIFGNFGIGVFAIANFAFGAVAALGNVAAAVGWSVGNIAAGYRAIGQITAQWVK